MIGKNPDGMIHQRRFGGGISAGGDRTGCYWSNLTDTQIRVFRMRDDDIPVYSWSQVRVMLWKIPEPPT